MANFLIGIAVLVCVICLFLCANIALKIANVVLVITETQRKTLNDLNSSRREVGKLYERYNLLQDTLNAWVSNNSPDEEE